MIRHIHARIDKIVMMFIPHFKNEDFEKFEMNLAMVAAEFSAELQIMAADLHGKFAISSDYDQKRLENAYFLLRQEWHGRAADRLMELGKKLDEINDAELLEVYREKIDRRMTDWAEQISRNSFFISDNLEKIRTPEVAG